MTAKRNKPGSTKATVQSEQFKPPAKVEQSTQAAPPESAAETVRAQTTAAQTPAAEPAPETPKRVMARFKVNSDTIRFVAHGPASYPVEKGEVELPATAEWYRPLIEGGILTRIG